MCIIPMTKLGTPNIADRRKVRFHKAVSLCFWREASWSSFCAEVGRNVSFGKVSERVSTMVRREARVGEWDRQRWV